MCKDFAKKFSKKRRIKAGKEGRKDEGGEKEKRMERGEWEDGFSSFLMIEQSLVGDSAASEQIQNRGGQMEGTQGMSKTMESSCGVR